MPNQTQNSNDEYVQEMQRKIEELESSNRELLSKNEKLAQSERRYRLIIEGVKDYAIFMLNPEGYIASWNEGARRFKGYEANEIIGKHFSTFYPEVDIINRKPEWELEKAISEGRMEDEGWRIRKDGTRFWANVVITRINDESGKLLGFSKVTRDLTERKMNEEKLKNAYQNLELRVQERTKELEIALKTRDEFLSIASHELKTPLTSLKLQLQMSRRKMASKLPAIPGTPIDITKSLDMGIRQVDSLSYLVDDLLDVSRMQTGVFNLSLKEIDLSVMVEEVVNRFSQQLLAAGCIVEFDLDSKIKGEWDRYRLEQVIVNLIFNVIKYAPGKPINISATLIDDDNIRLIVADSGPGIALEKQSKIFERFERVNTDRNIGGLGLGLFITRRIVEAHNGSIRVESLPGEGAKFIVELPIKAF